MATNPQTRIPSTAKRNIQTITEVEQALLHNRKVAERVGEKAARFFGSLLFIAAHIFFFLIWLIINPGRFARIPPFAPFPFSFLSLIVRIEFIFLTTFVLL